MAETIKPLTDYWGAELALRSARYYHAVYMAQILWNSQDKSLPERFFPTVTDLGEHGMIQILE